MNYSKRDQFINEYFPVGMTFSFWFYLIKVIKGVEGKAFVNGKGCSVHLCFFLANSREAQLGWIIYYVRRLTLHL